MLVASISARTARLFSVLILCAASASGQGPPAHDACADASLIAPLPFTDATMTTAATSDTEGPFPACGNQSSANSVWYRFTAGGAGTITANTIGSDYDTILSAYEGPCEELAAVPGACNDDAPRDGAQSEVSFPVQAGIPYSLMVTAYEGDGGNLLFDARFRLSPVCIGDCDDNGTASADECDACQRIQDGEPLGLCPRCDVDGDGQVADTEVNRCRLGIEGCLRCAGDCDGSKGVVANDLVAAAAIMAGCPCGDDQGGSAIGCAGLPTTVTACPSSDRDGDGCISAQELEFLLTNIFQCGS